MIEGEGGKDREGSKRVREGSHEGRGNLDAVI